MSFHIDLVIPLRGSSSGCQRRRRKWRESPHGGIKRFVNIVKGGQSFGQCDTRRYSQR